MHNLVFTFAALHPAIAIALWVTLGLVVSGIGFYVLSCFVASHYVFQSTLCRTDKSKWGREPQFSDERSMKMDAEGQIWQKAHAEQKRDVHIVRDGTNLYGEYYDLGFDRCVMVLSGRTESLRYGYYFAQPYAAAGWNVLVVDPRAHGLSDGVYNTVGFEESRDDVAWARFLQDELGVKQLIFHGICIGAAGGLYATLSPDCPDCVVGLVSDGMFPNFGQTMKHHITERKKPLLLVYSLINWRMKRHTGYSMNKGPIDVIDKMQKPLLMLYGRLDRYSRPEYAKKLFAKAGSEKKRLVWFENGEHSMLRVSDPERYDRAITEFLAENFAPVASK